MTRLLLLLALCGIAAAADRPNVLVFLVDDMGWQDTSVPFHHDSAGKPAASDLNRRYRTPNMEKLAAQGMKFTRAYAHPVDQRLDEYAALRSKVVGQAGK